MRTRRDVLTAGVAVLLAGALGGCGVRVEDDAGLVPFLPGRTPLPGEDALRLLVASCRRAAYRQAPDDVDAARILTTQHRVLRDALLRAGVPTEVVDDAGVPADAVPTADEQPGTELVLRCLDTVRDDFLPLVGTLAAQRIAATSWARTAQSWPAVDPQPWSGAAAQSAGRALQAVRAAVWALQVAAARSSDGTRRTLTSTLRAVSVIEQDLLVVAGPEAPPAPLGYRLPDGPPSPAQAPSLADEALRRLREQLAAQLQPLADDRGKVLAMSTWLAAVEVQAHRWGTPYTAFPGLKTPQ